VIRFYSISALRADIQAYCKNDSYKNCKNDICSLFSGKDISTIFELPILVAPSADCRLIKSRVDNSNYNKGKSGGYRLYFYADKPNECVFLLGFYPKTGKFGKSDLIMAELKQLIKTFSDERAARKLVEHDINKEFEEKAKNTSLVSVSSEINPNS
jgi:mRNA-degrading endonuclease RelE of RelBE toxin-antitoxin system